MKCRVCGTKDRDKPQIFKAEEWCSDNHRKLIAEEPGIEPTVKEWVTMDSKLFEALEGQWQAPDDVLVKRANRNKGI